MKGIPTSINHKAFLDRYPINKFCICINKSVVA